MEIKQFIKPSAIFLKAEIVNKSPTKIFVITTEGKIVDNEFKGKTNQRIHANGEMDKEPYIFNMCKTNARAVAKKLGENTTNWIGHQLLLEVYKTKTSEGNMVDALNVKDIK